jgi:putative hemolysin
MSAYMSASEVALFSLSRFQLRSIRERLRSTHRKIKTLLGDPSGLLITILIVNETVNIALSILITDAISGTQKDFLVPDFIPIWAVDIVLGIIVTTPVVLLLCEVTPKVVGARANVLVASLTVGPLILIYEFLRPIRRVLKRVLMNVSRIAGRATQRMSGNLVEDLPAAHAAEGKLLRESDFMLMVEEGHKEGAIHETELELIRNVFTLDDTPISEVFTPLSQVQSLVGTTSLKGALGAMRSQRYSRIPILSSDKKHVIGILYSKDLLRAKLEPELMTLPVSALMRKPLFVPPAMRLNTLFRRFKQQRNHMAVVQGPNLEAIGIVTMSDVLEALFEDILYDEEITLHNLTRHPETREGGGKW